MRRPHQPRPRPRVPRPRLQRRLAPGGLQRHQRLRRAAAGSVRRQRPLLRQVGRDRQLCRIQHHPKVAAKRADPELSVRQRRDRRRRAVCGAKGGDRHDGAALQPFLQQADVGRGQGVLRSNGLAQRPSAKRLRRLRQPRPRRAPHPQVAVVRFVCVCCGVCVVWVCVLGHVFARTA